MIKRTAEGRWVFSSESVTEGHPDKVCDQIADAVLDAILAQDPEARVACECIANTGMVMVFGEISTSCYVDIPQIARNTIREIGYNEASYGFEADNCAVMVSLKEQSPDIAMGVTDSLEIRQGEQQANAQLGAGDQGMMFGYASDETESLMPLPIDLAHRLTRRLAECRKEGVLSGLRPDGKAQVTVEYEGEQAKRVACVVLSTQHDPAYEQEKLRGDLIREVVKQAIPADLLDENSKIYINPTGRFVLGGPQADSGLTGRKIIVDTYGGWAPHGGGSFSGKDPTKVDRSATYMARYIARHLVAAQLARRCEVQLAYSIGVAQPVSIHIDCEGTSKLSESQLVQLVKDVFPLTPSGIIEALDLRRPIYKQTASYGHFGRVDLDLPWERLDRLAELQEAAKAYTEA